MGGLAGLKLLTKAPEVCRETLGPSRQDVPTPTLMSAGQAHTHWGMARGCSLHSSLARGLRKLIPGKGDPRWLVTTSALWGSSQWPGQASQLGWKSLHYQREMHSVVRTHLPSCEHLQGAEKMRL